MEKAGLSQDITPFLLYWEARFDIYKKNNMLVRNRTTGLSYLWNLKMNN